MGAVGTAVRQGKTLYVGISNYTSERTAEATAVLTGPGASLAIHSRRARCSVPQE